MSKHWRVVEITYLKFNSKGEVLKSWRHSDLIFSTEEKVVGLALARNPSPHLEEDVKTKVYFRDATDNDSFASCR